MERFSYSLYLNHEKADSEISEAIVNVINDILIPEEVRRNHTEELKTNITKSRDRLHTLDVSNTELQVVCGLKKDEIEKLLDKKKLLKGELQEVLAAGEELENDVECLSEEAKPLKEDMSVIERNRDLLKIYRTLTGLKWDFTAPSSDSVGYIANSVNNYVKHFCYPAEKSSCIWNEIEGAAHAKWADITLKNIVNEHAKKATTKRSEGNKMKTKRVEGKK